MKPSDAQSDPPVRVILAAGGLLWRRDRGRLEIALIFRQRYGDEWSLPKGKLERGETFEQGALREVREETCCEAELVDFLAPIAYRVRKGPKVVLFYEMRLVREHPFEPSNEVLGRDWLAPSEALARMTYPDEQRLVERWAVQIGDDLLAPE